MTHERHIGEVRPAARCPRQQRRSGSGAQSVGHAGGGAAAGGCRHARGGRREASGGGGREKTRVRNGSRAVICLHEFQNTEKKKNLRNIY